MAAAAVFALYALAVEPYWIEVTRHRVVGRVFSPVTIAHLSDLHTGGLGRRERKLLDLLAAERPDIVVVTGDLVEDAGFVAPGDGWIDEAVYAGPGEVLSRIRAPLGVWVSRGNWENWRRHPDEGSFYRAAGATLLVDEGRAPRRDLWVMGLDDPWTGQPDADAALDGAPEHAFRLAAFHAPVLLEAVAGRVDLALAGHTHGGQVRPPLVPPFWLPHGSGGYVAGWYQQAGTRMYVSRGIGTSTLPVRFRCRPELAVVTVTPGRPAP